MSSSATGVGMPICFLGAILLILTQKSSQKFGDVLGIIVTKDFITKGQLRLNEVEQLTCGVYRIKKADSFDSKNMATIRTIVEKVK